jgi:hypothetical protein
MTQMATEKADQALIGVHRRVFCVIRGTLLLS